MEKRFWCRDCGRSYKYRRGLAYHRKYSCGKEPMFKCQFCPKRCFQKGNLLQHSLSCKRRLSVKFGKELEFGKE